MQCVTYNSEGGTLTFSGVRFYVHTSAVSDLRMFEKLYMG